MEDPAAFGRRLRHARVDRGLSQTGLAAGICSPSSVSRWEDGQSVPDHDTVEQLADRLGMDPTVLTGHGFDSRLAGSADGFAELLHTVFATEDVSEYPISSAAGTWITRAQYILVHADPWSRGADPRPVIDDLAVDPLTASTPVPLETVELLDAMVRVRETPDRATVDSLTDTLTWTTDAPSTIRRTALDTVVAVLVNAGMPVAAAGAVTRVGPPRISATAATLLTWDLSSPGTPPYSSPDGLPPVAASRSARDVAFGILAGVRDAPEEVRRTVADAVVASCPDDGLVTLWAQKI
ncbi:helix-turn-helix domain-containing protein [uncultured Corynebacterium sp.]|uniref:helix-turn-helix domain-containing protein n=1 Tax=uncultured Corynebacterium sp. TaxID=159447 RepID=UPI0025EC9964|nr:helix-turn-helix transcriptional regulator [uncultured Corynebacterium sp.]